jgi:HK97 family phage major capsid protein
MSTHTQLKPWTDQDYWQQKFEAAESGGDQQLMSQEALQVLSNGPLIKTDESLLKSYFTEVEGRSGGGKQTAPSALTDPTQPAKQTPNQADHRVLTDKVAAGDMDQLDDAGFAGVSDFLRAIKGTVSGRMDDRLEMLAADSQIGSDDPSGGFLVPDAFQAQLLLTSDELMPFLAQRTRFEATSDSVNVPALADRDRSSYDIAGMALKRASESGTLPVSSLMFEKRKYDLTKAATLVTTSNELLQDSAVGMEAVLRRQFGRAIALRQMLDFVSGTGTGEPVGIMNSGALYSVAAEGGQSADTIVAGNVLGMRERAYQYQSCVWVAHPGTYQQLVQAHIAGTNSDSFIFQPGRGTDAPDTLLGRPIYFSAAAQLLGDAGDLMLFDPSSYIYIQKPVRIDASPHVNFQKDETSFRVVLRDAGAPFTDKTLTDARGFEVSEFLALDARD